MRNFVAPLVKLIIFLLVTAMATIILAGVISNSSYGDTNTYKALFTDASGIQEGDDVRIAGVRVGTVDSIGLVKSGDGRVAQVTFTVVKARPLPKSVQATIRYRNLVGQRYLEISQGGPGDSTSTLKSGDTIPIGQTAPALDLTLLFQGFQPLIKGLSADQINRLSDEVIQSLQGEGDAIATLFGTVADLTNSLADKDQVIGDVIDNLTQTLTIIGAHDTQLSDLIIQLRRFVSGLAGDRKALGDAIVGVNNLTTTTANLLTNLRGPLAKDVVDLTSLARNLNQGKGTIEYLINQIPPTVAALIRTASYGSWFNFYLCDLDGYVTMPNGQQRSLSSAPSQDARCN